MAVIRVLFLSDTHLGFDLSFRPRIEKVRRGPDFFKNYQRALEPAFNESIDIVVHGGDLLFRRKVPANLVNMALAPLLELADRGIPVCLVPGNHERGIIPYRLLAIHKNLHVFDEPQTVHLNIKNTPVDIAGFPYYYDNVRKNFPRIMQACKLASYKSGIRILCTHHGVEGATVGPSNYMFRYSEDVIRVHDIPSYFDAVLCGHIHRYQIITQDLSGKKVPVPIYYAGSIERTSFAEKDEPKGYLILEFDADKQSGITKHKWTFHELPTRPMISIPVDFSNQTPEQCEQWIANQVTKLPQHAIVQLDFIELPSPAISHYLNAAKLRELAGKNRILEIHTRGLRYTKNNLRGLGECPPHLIKNN